MTQTTENELAVRMVGITKRFPGVLANDHINFEARAGEIHALLGENGAGKSTLMSVLAGLYRADEGEIYLHGRRVHLRSPRDAITHGVGMVHQHFMLVPVMTVAENITLGLQRPRFLLNLAQIEQEVADLSEQYGLRVDPKARIWQLSVGEQQRVEILKMLYRGADVLIMDEPTAVLTPPEVEDLFVTLRRMANEGKTIIFIRHKLDEVMAISDRITVLREGRVVATVDTDKASPQELARMMVGREVLFRVEKQEVEKGDVVLEVQGLSALNDKGLPALKNVSFTIHRGEILGVAGVAGNGQREMAEVITGLRKATSGTVRIRGCDVTNCSPRRIITESVSHIPEDRLGMGRYSQGLPPATSVQRALSGANGYRSLCPATDSDLRHRHSQHGNAGQAAIGGEFAEDTPGPRDQRGPQPDGGRSSHAGTGRGGYGVRAQSTVETAGGGRGYFVDLGGPG